jgi:hypothetical protein
MLQSSSLIMHYGFEVRENAEEFTEKNETAA